MRPHFRAVMYSTYNGYNMTIYSEPFHYRVNAENMLDGMREENRCTGGHIEELICLAGRQPEWTLA